MVLKEVGASGQISLGKKYAGQLFEVRTHPDGRVEMLPMKAVPMHQPAPSPEQASPPGWLPPGGYSSCNAWASENQEALVAYAQRVQSEGTAAEQLQAFVTAQGPDAGAPDAPL